jgi:hypothetical protein
MRAFDRTGLKVQRIDDQRFADALAFFRDGKTLEFEETIMILDPKTRVIEVLKVTTDSPSSFDPAGASVEIRRAVSVYEHLLESSSEFAGIVAGYKPRFALVADYGMGSTEVCHLEGLKLSWN